jgi:RNA polymerase-binding transcription factor DksA
VAVRGEGGLLVADALDEALAAARGRVEDLRAELDAIFAAQAADPPDDEHDVEGASVGFERARVRALLTAAEASVSQLESAAFRRSTGESSSACESCGAPIGAERLAAVPATRQCVGCAARR